METRKLYRSQTDKIIGGVCGGLAEYFNIDPTLVRLIFVLLTLTPLHGVLLYIILWIITPARYSTTTISTPPSTPTEPQS